MPTKNQPPALPTLPAFPPAEENILKVAERLNQAQNLIKDGTIDKRELGNRTAIVNLEPYDDGFGIMKDNQTAKPQVFQTGDGWFSYNLAVNLAQM